MQGRGSSSDVGQLPLYSVDGSPVLPARTSRLPIRRSLVAMRERNPTATWFN
jgi:hypothetical protein